MFEYQDFTEAPFMQDSRVRTIYDGLKEGPAEEICWRNSWYSAGQGTGKAYAGDRNQIYENLTGIGRL